MAGDQQRCGKRDQLEEWFSQAPVHFPDCARGQQKVKFRSKEQFMDPYTKESRRRGYPSKDSLAQGSVLLVKEIF